VRTYSSPVTLQIPSGADWVSVKNYSQAGANGVTTANFNGTANASVGIEFYWQRGMAPGTAIVKYKGATSAVLSEDTLVSGGFTLYDPSTSQSGSLNNGSTGISGMTAANPAVATVGSTAGMSSGVVVRLTSLNNNQSAYNSLDFTVGIGALTATTFSVDYLNALNSTPATSGNFRVIGYPITTPQGLGIITTDGVFYPRRRYITNISAATSAVITLSVQHNYTVGQEIRLSLPGGSAIWGDFANLDNYSQPNPSTSPDSYIITAVDTALGVGHNTITINANTNGFKVATTNVGFAGGTSWFPVFTTPLSAFTPAQVVPFGEDTATALAQSPQLSSLGDAVQNVGFLGMVLGGGGNGTALTTPIVGPAGSGTTSNAGVITAPDTLYWLAGKSTYGGL
jgi:hypothetical protein